MELKENAEELSGDEEEKERLEVIAIWCLSWVNLFDFLLEWKIKDLVFI